MWPVTLSSCAAATNSGQTRFARKAIQTTNPNTVTSRNTCHGSTRSKPEGPKTRWYIESSTTQLAMMTAAARSGGPPRFQASTPAAMNIAKTKID